VGEVTATGSDSYSFIDEKPANGISFYRVRNIDIDGKYKYTTIVRVNLNRSIELRAYPQPAKDEITIEHASAAKGILTLATATGQVVKTLQVKPDANQTSINITSLNRGLYIVRFDNGEGSIESLRVVKQ
jgi:predicted helicase